MQFLGVFAQNEILNLNPKPGNFFIVNLDFSFENGSHWIAFKFKKSQIEIYDSLGMNVYGWLRKPFHALQFLFKFSKTHSIFLTPQLQNSFSNLCGVYVLFFLLTNLNLNESLSYFTHCQKTNDILLLQLLTGDSN